MEKTFYSTPELAELLGVFHSTVRRWIERDQIKGFRVGRNYKIPATEVKRMLELHGLSLPDALKSRQMTKEKKSPADSFQRKGSESVLQRLMVVDDIDEPALVFRQGVILGTNKPFADLLGCCQIDLIGVSLHDVLDGINSDVIGISETMGSESNNEASITQTARLKTCNGQSKEFVATIDGIEGIGEVHLLIVNCEK